MKKLWSVLLCAGLVVGLWACSDEPVKGAVTQPPGLTVTCGEETLISRKKRKMTPGEMEYVTLKASVLEKLPEDAKLVVSTKEA